MKISNLKIYDKDNSPIRDISFKTRGISFVFGEIKKPDNERETSNKLGKTLLLRFIDYLFGANEDKKAIKKEIHGYKIVGNIIDKDKNYVVERILGSSSLKVNGESIGLQEYRERFNISRATISKQILLDTRQNIISQIGHNANSQDISSSMQLLNMPDLAQKLNEVDKLRKEVIADKSGRDKLVALLEISKDAVDCEYYKNKKEIDQTNLEINDLNSKISSLSLSENKEKYQYRYSELNYENKDLNSQKNHLINERRSLKSFIENLKDFSTDEKLVQKIYRQTNIELKEYVLRQMTEVSEFYRSIVKDRKKFILAKIEEIDNELLNIDSNLNKNRDEMNAISKILSENDIFQDAIKMSALLNQKIQTNKVKEGRLDGIRKIYDEIKLKDKKISEINLEIAKLMNEDSIEECKQFVYHAVSQLYNNATANFDIRTYTAQSRIPISIQLEIQGTTSSGINKTQNALMDYLFFIRNKDYEILVQDSSCFDSIDTRQVEGLIRILRDILLDIDKQAIVSLNKYQISDKGMISYIEKNSSVILSEKDTLLRITF